MPFNKISFPLLVCEFLKPHKSNNFKAREKIK